MKEAAEAIDLRSRGRELHCLAAQNENALSPNRVVWTLGTSRMSVSVEDLSVRLGRQTEYQRDSQEKIKKTNYGIVLSL